MTRNGTQRVVAGRHPEVRPPGQACWTRRSPQADTNQSGVPPCAIAGSLDHGENRDGVHRRPGRPRPRPEAWRRRAPSRRSPDKAGTLGAAAAQKYQTTNMLYVPIINGIIFTYMGLGKAPVLPHFDCFVAPKTHSFAFKGYLECNWLQAVEVGIDPSHASFLHRYLKDHDPEYGLQFGGMSGDSQVPMTSVLRNHVCPDIKVEENEFGMRLITTRKMTRESMHVRVTNLVFPNLIVIPMTNDMCISQWHVPIDDTHSWWYALFTAFDKEVDKQAMRDQRLELYTLPDYKPRINRTNKYGYDPEEQRNETFTGMGLDINVHDQWAVESPGAIYDRTNCLLYTSDAADE